MEERERKEGEREERGEGEEALRRRLMSYRFCGWKSNVEILQWKRRFRRREKERCVG